jgi:hypothetical protein
MLHFVPKNGVFWADMDDLENGKPVPLPNRRYYDEQDSWTTVTVKKQSKPLPIHRSNK